MSLIVWIYTISWEQFWLYSWWVVTAFSIFMMMFYSSLIVPLFNFSNSSLLFIKYVIKYLFNSVVLFIVKSLVCSIATKIQFKKDNSFWFTPHLIKLPFVFGCIISFNNLWTSGNSARASSKIWGSLFAWDLKFPTLTAFPTSIISLISVIFIYIKNFFLECFILKIRDEN